MMLFSSLDLTLSRIYILPEDPCIEIRGPGEYVQGQFFPVSNTLHLNSNCMLLTIIRGGN